MANQTDYSDEALVKFIRDHALRHYAEGGWDYLVECWDDAAILGEVKNCRSADAAIRKLRKTLKLKDDYRKEMNAMWEY
jgi:hypothetical protein